MRYWINSVININAFGSPLDTKHLGAWQSGTLQLRALALKGTDC